MGLQYIWLKVCCNRCNKYCFIYLQWRWWMDELKYLLMYHSRLSSHSLVLNPTQADVSVRMFVCKLVWGQLIPPDTSFSLTITKLTPHLKMGERTLFLSLTYEIFLKYSCGFCFTIIFLIKIFFNCIRQIWNLHIYVNL